MTICSLIKSPNSNQPWTECSPLRDDNDPTLLCYISCSPDGGTSCITSAKSGSPDFPAEFQKILDDHNGKNAIKLPAGMSPPALSLTVSHADCSIGYP